VTSILYEQKWGGKGEREREREREKRKKEHKNNHIHLKAPVFAKISCLSKILPVKFIGIKKHTSIDTLLQFPVFITLSEGGTRLGIGDAVGDLE
jgi:hypothetical protein